MALIGQTCMFEMFTSKKAGCSVLMPMELSFQRPIRRGLRVLLSVALLLFLLLGPLLEVTHTGSGFIFFYAAAYAQAAPWVGLALAAPIYLGLYIAESRYPYMRQRYPTRWVRALMWPGTVAFGAFLCVVAPLGWIAFAARLVGEPVYGVEARVLTVDAPRERSRGCKQRATIQYSSASARLCMEDRLWLWRMSDCLFPSSSARRC